MSRDQKNSLAKTRTLRNCQKVFQILLKFSLYVLAATQTPDLQESFSIDRIGAGETGYFITLGDDPFRIHENRQFYVPPFPVFLCRLYLG